MHFEACLVRSANRNAGKQCGREERASLHSSLEFLSWLIERPTPRACGLDRGRRKSELIYQIADPTQALSRHDSGSVWECAADVSLGFRPVPSWAFIGPWYRDQHLPALPSYFPDRDFRGVRGVALLQVRRLHFRLSHSVYQAQSCESECGQIPEH